MSQVPFEGKGRLATKMKITFSMKNEFFEIFSYNNFFEKIKFFEKMGKKIFGGHDRFFRREHLTPKMSIL